VAGHPLGHWGGWATTRPAGLVVAKPPQWPKGVAGPPPVKEEKKNVKEEGWHRGWFDHPLRPLGWLGHHQTGLVVAEPPQWPKGVVEPPPVKEKKKNVKEEGWHKGWSGNPLRPLGWLGHHQTKKGGIRGGSTTPLGHWGGSATTRPAGLVVAEPPQWPKGVAGPPTVKEKEEKKKKKSGGRPPLCHPSSFTFFFFFFFFFSLTGGGPATPLGHWPVWWWPSHPNGRPPPVPPFFFHVFFFFFFSL
jgi:hypothetical protein